MSNRKNWNEVRAASKVTPAQVATARADLERSAALHELRVAMGFTQKQLAGALGMTQPGVSRIEGQADLLLSTLRSYVEAIGGELDLCARFGDNVVHITSLGELDREESAA